MTISEYLNKIYPLSKEQSLEIENKTSFKECKAGEYIIMQGKICRKLIFLQNGTMASIYENDRKTFIKDFILDYNMASVYDSFIMQSPAKYSLLAVTQSTYQYINYNDLSELYKKIPILYKIAKVLTDELYINVTRRMESLTLLTAEARYLELLNERPILLEKVPLYMVASYLGITDVALSRIRARVIK